MTKRAQQEAGFAALEAAGVLSASRGVPGGSPDTSSGLPGTPTQYHVDRGEGVDEAAGSLFEVDGHSLEGCPVVCPGDSDALGRSLAILSDHRMTALVRGGGSSLGIGNPPGPIDVVLETRGLSGVTDFEFDDGVVQVRAGTPLSVLRQQVEAEGWVLRLDPSGAGSTVGGTLAAAAVGPRVLGLGKPRDCVLGLDVVLGSGELTTCGGRVVKNVTGYDMAKLYTGSFGTLGVIASAWLRLAPIAESKQILTISSDNFENMFSLSLEASRRASARAAALLSPLAAQRARVSGADAVNQWVLVFEVAGDEAATRCDADWLKDRARASGAEFVELVEPVDRVERVEPADRVERVEPADRLDAQPVGPGPVFEDAVDRVRALQAGTLATGGIRARLAALPTALCSIVDALADSCSELVLHPGVGLVYAFSAGGRQAGVAAIDACTHAAAKAGASLLLEALPPAAKIGRDVFGEFGPEIELMRGLKQRFDPAGVLNPRRFVGGI